MSNVLSFSNKVLTRDLDTKVEDLDELYETMKLCYSTMETLEEKIRQEESEYDKLFASYVTKVGFDNILLKYVEYVSGDIAVNVKTGEIEYLTLEEEKPEE
tara:strand:- start:686 stop:988 length:303 start_codon:yes stop_codon:yes gene_type:complete